MKKFVILLLLATISVDATASRYIPNEDFSLLDILLLPVSMLLIYFFTRVVDRLESLFNKLHEAYNKSPSNFIQILLGFFGILFFIYAIISSQSNKTSKVDTTHLDSHSNQIQPPTRTEEKSKLIKLGESTGKYGKFVTYLETSLVIKVNQTYTSVLTMDEYNTCLDKMPYWKKFRVILFDCSNRKFFVGRQITAKDGITIQDVTFKEKELNIKHIVKDSIESKVSNIICK